MATPRSGRLRQRRRNRRLVNPDKRNFLEADWLPDSFRKERDQLLALRNPLSMELQTVKRFSQYPVHIDLVQLLDDIHSFDLSLFSNYKIYQKLFDSITVPPDGPGSRHFNKSSGTFTL